jgi:hypothetical protein
VDPTIITTNQRGPKRKSRPIVRSYCHLIMYSSVLDSSCSVSRYYLPRAPVLSPISKLWSVSQTACLAAFMSLISVGLSPSCPLFELSFFQIILSQTWFASQLPCLPACLSPIVLSPNWPISNCPVVQMACCLSPPVLSPPVLSPPVLSPNWPVPKCPVAQLACLPLSCRPAGPVYHLFCLPVVLSTTCTVFYLSVFELSCLSVILSPSCSIPRGGIHRGQVWDQ